MRVLVTCAGSGELHVLALDAAQGRLRPAQVIPLGGMLMPMAVHPDGRHVYVARRSEPLAVISLAVGADGTLVPLGEAPLPASMAYLACDRTGRHLMAASYGQDCVAIGPIDAHGVASVPAQVRATLPHAHAIVADPANRYVYATSLGGDVIHRYRLDTGAGRLHPTDPETTALRARSGPRHLVFRPDGQRLYLLNERDATVDVHTCEPDDGSLCWMQSSSLAPPEFEGRRWAAELRLTPDAGHLLATERGSDTVTVFALDAVTGLLHLRGRHPAEAQPRGMQVAPDGRHVVVAGQVSGHVALLSLGADGTLDPRDRVAVGADPNWVEILALPH